MPEVSLLPEATNASEDPVVNRLDDALDIARDIERRSQQGEVIPPSVLATQSRAMIDEMLAARRDEIVYRNNVENKIDSKLNRQPWESYLKWGGRSLASLVLLYLGYLVTKGAGG